MLKKLFLILREPRAIHSILITMHFADPRKMSRRPPNKLRANNYVAFS